MLHRFKPFSSVCILALFGGLFLTACQKADQSRSKPASSPLRESLQNPSNSHPSAQSVRPSNLNGTTDGAGGNGTKNKIFEGYAVDPTQLPAFTKNLNGIFRRWNKIIIKRQRESVIPPKHTIEKLAEDFFRLKTWYIAPVELKTLSNEAIGFSFSKNESEQLALQTSAEIWIDQKKYNRMSFEDQAALILHELIMSIYFQKFSTLPEVCRRLPHPQAQGFCPVKKEDEDFIIGWFSPEARRSLEATDYENIRNVTSWLLQNGEEFDEIQFKNILAKNKFPVWLFPENESDQKENRSLSYQGSIKDLFDKNSAVQKKFTYCHFLTLNISEPCKISLTTVTEIKSVYNAKTSTFIRDIVVELSNGQKITHQIIDENREWHPYKAIIGSGSPEFDWLYYFSTDSFGTYLPGRSEFTLGQKAAWTEFFLKKDVQDYEENKTIQFVGMTISPIVIGQILPGKNDRKGYLSFRIKAKSLDEDMIIISESKEIENSIKKLHAHVKPEERLGGLTLPQ